MTLDFTNYTFSGLITLLAAILGIGYPLFLESIRKIDEQYKSTRLSARFQKEWVFRGYRYSLVVAIAVSFCVPFLMLLFPINTVCIVALTVQALAVLVLVFMMLAVFQVIQEYYDPGQLIFHFEDMTSPVSPIIVDDLSQTDLMCLVDLMRYSARRNNREVYEKCKSRLTHFVFQEESKLGKEEEYNVSQAFFDAFLQIADYSKDENNLFFYNDNIASQVFYNYFFKYEIGLKTYQLLWRSACVVANGGSDEWFRQHWSYAVQYFTFHYKNYHQITSTSAAFYKEQHFMLGVLAMYYKRYDWLRIVLFHSQSDPPSYPLVPSTFSAIVDSIRPLEEQRRMPWQLTAKYQMKGLFSDIDSDDQLLIQAYRYVALLFIRLYSVNNYNITYSDPMEVPSPDPNASIYDYKKEIEIIERIKYQVRLWFEGAELDPIELPNLPDKEEVYSLLDQYMTVVKDQMQYNIDHPLLDKDQMETLKGLLVNAENQYLSSIPSNTIVDNANEPEIIAVSDRVDNQFCTKGGLGTWSNYPDVLITCLNEKLNLYYDRLLGSISSCIYTISERNIFKALSLLNPDKDDVILSMGVYLPQVDNIYNDAPILKHIDSEVYFNETEIVTRTSYQSSIIIMRRVFLPLIAYLPPTEEMKNNSLLELPNSPTHLCSNIDQVISDNQPSPVVRIARNVKSHISPNAKCTTVVVKQNVDDAMDMARLEQSVKK